MKKLITLVAIMTLFAASASADVVNSVHNLSSAGPSSYSGTNDNGQVCVYCHTPHGASTVAGTPLWNRTVVNATTVYDSSALVADVTQAAVDASDAPLCLSCHSGTALGTALLNPPNAALAFAAPATTLTGTAFDLDLDLSNDHPIGFTFAAAGEIQAPTTALVNFGATGNQMWCSSCHDVHDDTIESFLLVTIVGSQLCLDCHIK